MLCFCAATRRRAEEDPEHAFFGSQERKRAIIAAWTQKLEDCCDERIIA